MERATKSIEVQGDVPIGELILMLQQNKRIWDYVNANYRCSRERYQLLHEILHEDGNISGEGREAKVYLYGSLVKEGDLLARQMFLWMLGGMAETT